MKDKIFCFDFDGTLTREEVLPQISKEIDLYEEFKVLTDATIRGLIPLHGSLKLRFRLLEDIPLIKIKSVINQIHLHTKIVDFINNSGMDCCIITANMDLWLEDLSKKVKCPFYTSNIKYKDNKVIETKFIDKQKVVEELKLKYKKIICVGEGMGDCGMFTSSHARIAFGSVHYPVETMLEISDFYVNSEEQLCRLLKML